MPPFRSHKRRRVACQHFPDDQTLRLQAGAGEDDVIHLPSGLDRVDCERQEEEEEGTPVATLPAAWRYRVNAGTGWPGVGEMESLICNFYLSVAAREIVWADLSL